MAKPCEPGEPPTANRGGADCPARTPDLLAHAALGLARVRLENGDLDEVLVRLLEAALRALGNEVSTRRVHLLARLVESLYFSPDPARRQRLSLQALSLAQQVDDRGTLAAALMARYFALGEPERGGRAGRRGAAAGRSRPQRDLESLTYKILALFELGDLGAMDRGDKVCPPRARPPPTVALVPGRGRRDVPLCGRFTGGAAGPDAHAARPPA